MKKIEGIIWPDLDNPDEVIEGLRFMADQRVDMSKRSIYTAAVDLLEKYRAAIQKLQRSKK